MLGIFFALSLMGCSGGYKGTYKSGELEFGGEKFKVTLELESNQSCSLTKKRTDIDFDDADVNQYYSGKYEIKDSGKDGYDTLVLTITRKTPDNIEGRQEVWTCRIYKGKKVVLTGKFGITSITLKKS